MSDLRDEHHDHDHEHDHSESHARREFLKQTAVASMILGAGIAVTTPVAAGPLVRSSATSRCHQTIDCDGSVSSVLRASRSRTRSASR